MIEPLDPSSARHYDSHRPFLPKPRCSRSSSNTEPLRGSWQRARLEQSHHGPDPVQRRRSDKPSVSRRPLSSTPRLNLYIAFAILIACCCSLTSASTSTLPPKITDPFLDDDVSADDLRAAIAQLAESGTIVVDPRPRPPGTVWQIESVEEGILGRRQDSDPFASSQSSTKVSATPSSSKGPHSSTAATVAPSSKTSGNPASGTLSPSPLPSPFDSSLGANFTTQSCPDFITSFLKNETFKACLPLSLLLESSNSFFQAEKSIVRITQTLDATCAADVNSCSDLMSNLAVNLTSESNCGADYDAQNPTVIQAYTGLIAYQPIYQASCLKNPATSSYCFADAVTNASSPTDSYVYYIALNSSLPGGTQPTCSVCLQNTMAVFDAAAANRSQPVASTYVAAAQQINVLCGPGFVNASIPAPVTAGATAPTASVVPLLTLLMFVMAWLF